LRAQVNDEDICIWVLFSVSGREMKADCAFPNTTLVVPDGVTIQ
jgi:hypothetical protein